MNSPDHIWLLISKKLAGEASEPELEELQLLVRDNPEMAGFLESAKTIWETGVTVSARQVEEAFARHIIRMDGLSRRKKKTNIPIWESDSKFRDSVYRVFNLGVISNYFKVIYRNLYRFKSFSIINISGLAIGMASAILILLLVQNELSYDQFHEKKDRIYMLNSRGMVNGRIELFGTPSLLTPVLKSEYPQVEDVTRLNGTGPIVLSANDKQIEGKGMMVDSGFLKIFSYPFLRGNPETALNSPRSVVLTESFAKKFFPDGDAMGKMMRVDSNNNFIVTGILKDLPNNTEFQDAEYFLPWSYMKEIGWEINSWDRNDQMTVVLVRPGITEKIANERFRDVLKRHAPGQLNKEVFVHPLAKWRLWSRFENGKIVGGGIESVRLYILLAAFILLIACINYMNLSTARSVKRGKEV